MSDYILRGIDVSRWQGDFNFSAAKSEGFDFAVIKAGGGDAGLYTDSKFERNYAEAKAAGMSVGAYWFSRALSVAEAEAEADYFYNLLKGKQFDLPVYMDVEAQKQLSLGRRAVTDIIKAFCGRLESYGYWAGIYASLYNFKDAMYDEELQIYAHWVAQWASRCNYPNKAILGLWQYGGETNFIRSNKVAGVVCDQDYLLINYPEEIKAAGKNGYNPAPEPPAEFEYWPPRELKPGMVGNDVAVLQALLIAHNGVCNINGVYDADTQKAVTEYQSGSGLPETGIADRNTWKKLIEGV